MRLNLGSTNALMVCSPEMKKKDAHNHQVQVVQADQVVHHHHLEVAQVVHLHLQLLQSTTNALMVTFQHLGNLDVRPHSLIHNQVIVLYLCTYAQMVNTLSLDHQDAHSPNAPMENTLALENQDAQKPAAPPQDG